MSNFQAIYKAALLGNSEQLAQFLGNIDEFSPTKGPIRHTAAQKLAQEGHIEAAEFLRAHGANVNAIARGAAQGGYEAYAERLRTQHGASAECIISAFDTAQTIIDFLLRRDKAARIIYFNALAESQRESVKKVKGTLPAIKKKLVLIAHYEQFYRITTRQALALLKTPNLSFWLIQGWSGLKHGERILPYDILITITKHMVNELISELEIRDLFFKINQNFLLNRVHQYALDPAAGVGILGFVRSLFNNAPPLYRDRAMDFYNEVVKLEGSELPELPVLILTQYKQFLPVRDDIPLSDIKTDIKDGYYDVLQVSINRLNVF